MTMMFRAGAHPPTFVPFCSRCDLPVTKVMYRVPKEDVWAVEFEAQCCGKTQGRRISLADMRRISETGEKFYLIVRKGGFQQIKAQARR